MDSKLITLKIEELLPMIISFPWFKNNFSIQNAEILGRGGFGVVISTTTLQNPLERIAVKLIFPQTDLTISEYMKEINFMTSLVMRIYVK